MSEEEIVKQNLQAAVNAMNSKNLYDVTIICTTDDHQADFWMEKLSKGVCCATSDTKNGDDDGDDFKSKFPMVLAVSEDWNDAGGAGNGLGTLYAFQKATKLAKKQYGDSVNLEELLLENKISAALYHTAGKGTRLAPLPASENNNKPGVKLPYLHKVSDNTYQPLTVLEAVVKQTGIYASSRKGRLSVYWGDQVFIPSSTFTYEPKHHIDILCTLLGEKAPTEEEWIEQGLEKYGVIAVINPTSNGDSDDSSSTKIPEAAQVEKVSHSTATEMLQKLGSIGSVGPSLGSFSISAQILQLMCNEYKTELESKTGKYDTDPHFWMPLTLSETDYITLMKQKDVDEETSKKHYDRMDNMIKNSNLMNNGDDGKKTMGLFGAVNVGKEAAWWDYGQLKLYNKNSLLLLDKENSEYELLHQFLGISSTDSTIQCTLPTNGTKIIDNTSRILNTKIKSSCNINHSIISSCIANAIETDNGSIVVNCVTTKKIKTHKNCILINVISENDDIITTTDGEVIVNVMNEDGSKMTLKSRIDIDGGKSWKIKLDELNNTMSFEDVHKKNKEANIQIIENKRNEIANNVATTLGL